MARLPVAFGVGVGMASFESALEAAQAAEAAGYESISLGDRPQAPGLDGWTLATAIAARTEKVRIFHTTFNLPYRYPQLIAKQAASLDVISKGRLDLCLGAGGASMSADYVAYGIPMRSDRERLDDLIEAIELMRGLWTQDKFSYEGAHFQLRDAVCEPKPVNGTVPIWTGAARPRGLRIVGRLADGWMKNQGWGSTEDLTSMNAIATRAAERAGRDPDAIRSVLGGQTFVARTPEEAAAFKAENPTAAGLIGTVEQILETIKAYREAGVDTFLIRNQGPTAREQVQRFASEVMPEARKLPLPGPKISEAPLPAAH